MSISPGSDSSDTQQALGRFGLMALGLVAAGALLFMAIGMVSGDGDPVAAPTEGPTATATATPDQATEETAAATEPTAEPTDDATDDGSGEIVNPDATASASPEDGDGDGGDGDGSEPTEDGSDGAIPNEEISVQVLDGILSDGGARAREVADDLVAAGHPLVNFGSSSRGYDETTVFYTEGQEDEGRQVAADNGWDVVRPASDVGLSDSVDVHVVVGQDEA